MLTGSSENSIKNSTQWPFSLLEGGIPRGVLIEISGPAGGGKTEVILNFLAENPQLRVAWIENDFTIYPCAILQQQVTLDRILFVETSEYLWAAYQILKSQIFEIVVLTASVSNTIHLRRLQIAAKKSGMTVLLLTEYLTQEGAWPVAIQLKVMRLKGLPQIAIRKQKVRPLLSNV